MANQNVRTHAEVRTTTAGGVFLGYVSLQFAHRLIRENRAKGMGGNNKRKFQTLVRFDKFVDVKIPGGVLKTTYYEDLGDTRSVITSKRLVGSEFKPYDRDLTFQELRAGKLISAATKLRRAQAREQAAFARH